MVSLDSDGTWTYLPNEGQIGIDAWTYRVSDNNGGISDSATVTISVAADNGRQL